MADFPHLKTEVVTQYPAERRTEIRTSVVRFLDGTEQRCRQSAGPLKSWIVRLELLDEAEATALEEFFRDRQGTFGTFRFTDPGDGTVHENCSLAGDEAAWKWDGEMRGSTLLTIRENRA